MEVKWKGADGNLYRLRSIRMNLVLERSKPEKAGDESVKVPAAPGYGGWGVMGYFVDIPHAARHYSRETLHEIEGPLADAVEQWTKGHEAFLRALEEQL